MEPVPTIQLSDLPQSVQPLAKIIGVKKTVLIMDEYGGRGVYFSKSGKRFEELKKLIGEPEAEQFFQFYGFGVYADEGFNINLPRGTKLKTLIKHRNIARDRQSGLSLNQLAKKYCITQRTVMEIVKKSKQEH